MEANNTKAMRDALECIDSIAKYLEAGTIRDVQHAYRNIQDHVRIALAKPPRNCDVGTAEEQADRFVEFCDEEKGNREHCRNCSLCNAQDCELAWAQMPYNGETR